VKGQNTGEIFPNQPWGVFSIVAFKGDNPQSARGFFVLKKRIQGSCKPSLVNSYSCDSKTPNREKTPFICQKRLSKKNLSSKREFGKRLL